MCLNIVRAESDAAILAFTCLTWLGEHCSLFDGDETAESGNCGARLSAPPEAARTLRDFLAGNGHACGWGPSCRT